MQVEEDALAEQRLDLGARRCAEGFDGAAALADDDPFLAFAFDVEHGPNIYRLRALPELIDLTGHAVGELFMQLLERRLPNELRREEAHRLGGQLVGIIMKGTFRQLPGNRGEEGVDTFTGNGRNEDFRRSDGRTAGRPNDIGFRVYRDDWSTRQTLEAGYGGERRRRVLGEWMQVGDHFGVLDGAQRRSPHHFVQLVFGLEQTGGVGEDVLRVVFGEQANHGEPGRLWLGGHDRKVFAYKRVQQRRFADIGPAGQDNGTATGHGSKCRTAWRLARVGGLPPSCNSL